MKLVPEHKIFSCDMLKKHFVYRHVRLDSNVPFYIGCGTNTVNFYFLRAFSKKRNRQWHKVTSLTDYRVEILFTSDDQEEMFLKEKEFIALYGRVNMGTGTLVNLTDGGRENANSIVSQETKDHLSKINTGKKLGPVTLRRMAASQLSRNNRSGNNSLSKPVYQYSINGEFVKKWDSQTDAFKELSMPKSSISKACSGNHYANNAFWYSTFQGEKITPVKITSPLKIIQKDMTGNVVNIYKNIRQASKAMCGTRGWVNKISEACKGTIDSYQNYTWSYD